MRTKGKCWWKRRNSNPRPCVTGRRSNQLNYAPAMLLRLCRIVPLRSLRFPTVSETSRKYRDSERSTCN